MNTARNAKKMSVKRESPLKQIILYCALIVVLVGLIYVAISAWMSYQDMQKQAIENKNLVATGTKANATPKERQAAEGRDESQEKDSLAGYQVEASLPRAIYANSIGVKGRILPMSVNADGSMQAPINIFDAGWYNGSVKPGQKGAAIVVAHASGPTREGLFAYADNLKTGDQITIERGDGKKLNYQVIETKSVPIDVVDMQEMMVAHGGDEGLNLMTCGGAWLKDKKTFDQRIMIFTKRVS